MTFVQALRVTARIGMATVWTGCMFLVRLSVIPFRWASPRFEARCRRALVRVWGRGTHVILGMRVTVRGTPPAAPFFLVSNHVSHLDAYLLAGLLGCTFVAKSEVARWPVVGVIARQAGIIFVQREKRRDTLAVNERIGEALERGDGVTVFAESTTSRGLEIQPFKTALLEAAIRNNIPVHYATIHYATGDGLPPASEWVCWWDGVPLSFGRHLSGVFAQPGFTATVTYGETPITAPDRKALAQALWEAATKQFTPIE